MRHTTPNAAQRMGNNCSVALGRRICHRPDSPLGLPFAGSFLAQKHQLQGRHDHEQHDGPQQHPADDHGSQRALYLAADARRECGGYQADTGGQGGHEHGSHAFFGRVAHGLDRRHALVPQLVEVGDDEDSQMKHANLRYTWIQLGFLAFVTAIPFTTELLTEFITFRLALLIYWANILMLGLFVFISLAYAAKNHLLKNKISRENYGSIRRRVLTGQTLYAIGAALCVINTYWSIGFIVLVQLNYAIAPKIPWICELTA